MILLVRFKSCNKINKMAMKMTKSANKFGMILNPFYWGSAWLVMYKISDLTTGRKVQRQAANQLNLQFKFITIDLFARRKRKEKAFIVGKQVEILLPSP